MDHLCCACGGAINFDNCDGPVEYGGEGSLGSTEAFQCKAACYEWCHNTCGDPKQELCKPCLSEAAVA